MKNFITIFAVLALVACTEEEPPVCELETYAGATLNADRIIDTGEAYERWCGDRYIGTVEATAEAMTDACSDRGALVDERWECQAWHHTSFDDTKMICDCRPTPE